MSKQETPVEWLARLYTIPTYLVERAIKVEAERMEQQYQDGKEIGMIQVLAEKSTSEASKYADSYYQGYETALKLIKWKIDNELKSK
jgi:hypothetical protein